MSIREAAASASRLQPWEAGIAQPSGSPTPTCTDSLSHGRWVQGCQPHASVEAHEEARADTWERRRYGGHGHGRHGDAAEGAVVGPTGGSHRGRGLDARARASRRALLRQAGRVFPSLPRRLHLWKQGEERDEHHYGEAVAGGGLPAPTSSQARAPRGPC